MNFYLHETIFQKFNNHRYKKVLLYTVVSFVVYAINCQYLRLYMNGWCMKIHGNKSRKKGVSPARASVIPVILKD
jgi:hypothetical protein